MPELLIIDDLLEHMDRSELTQLAGIGSHNTAEGRVLDEAKIDAAISFASEMVRSYLQRRFPIIMEIDADQTPNQLKGYLSDIVRYRLRARSGNRNTVTDEVRDRFKDAKEWLRDVSQGRANLDLSNVDGGEDAQATGAVNPNGKIHVSHKPTRAGSILDGYVS